MLSDCRCVEVSDELFATMSVEFNIRHLIIDNKEERLISLLVLSYFDIRRL